MSVIMPHTPLQLEFPFYSLDFVDRATLSVCEVAEKLGEMIQRQGAVFGHYAKGAMEKFIEEADPAIITPAQYDEWAREALGEIIAYIAADSLQNAQSIKADIIKAIRSLSVLPERAPFLDGEFIPYNKYRKLVIAKRFLVIYQFKDETVYVDYVVDCRQDYQWLIK